MFRRTSTKEGSNGLSPADASPVRRCCHSRQGTFTRFSRLPDSGQALELIPKLDENLASFEHRSDCRPSRLNQAPQARIRRVPTGDQDDLRRWSVLLHEVDEVAVLSHDDDVCIAGGCEDLCVRRTLKIQVTNRQAFDGERRTHPCCERRWQLIIEPERHAATMG